MNFIESVGITEERANQLFDTIRSMIKIKLVEEKKSSVVNKWAEMIKDLTDKERALIMMFLLDKGEEVIQAVIVEISGLLNLKEGEKQ